MNQSDIQKINKEREEQLAKLINSGEIGVMTEACLGTTIGDISLKDGKIKKTTDTK